MLSIGASDSCYHTHTHTHVYLTENGRLSEREGVPPSWPPKTE